ncbi:MAG: acetyl-CoA carboxylase biotin carboxyl carrier protein subunit [Pseudomonadales bacterium]|nr:acetyl-CoA carboxylase biotin carboxyl carrier protein subunit [Pseudomonadales bacterium]
MSRIEVESEITGNVWKIELKVGDKVEAEDVIMILESMKMEIPVEAPSAGTIVEILVKEEDSVEEDQILAIIES